MQIHCVCSLQPDIVIKVCRYCKDQKHFLRYNKSRKYACRVLISSSHYEMTLWLKAFTDNLIEITILAKSSLRFGKSEAPNVGFAGKRK